ncbi:MAG: hypothetical protein CVU65_03205 [Deltaproteobacteria bacterium HGW-Deltaproteobacteria-22]|jgi:hypothetical protein|nr:MAG: hypothetical protein CVU65_03205 [Deltaproteobacteria bacterium HGW-Deltaproteobacteria-22]
MRKPEISLNRLARLLWMDARFWARPLAIGGTALGLLVLVFSFIAAFSRSGDTFHSGAYAWIMGLGGLIFTSRAFLELRHPLSTQNYLLIPASFEEKFIARYLLTSVGYLGVSYLGYLLLQLLSEGINQLVLGRSNPLFFVNNLDHLQVMAVYLAFQSLFFAGAVYYRKYSLIKTWLSVMALFFVLTVFGYLVFRLFLHGYFDGMQANENVMMTFARMGITGDLTIAYYPFKIWLTWVGRIWFWGVMPVCALAFAYFRLRETEV